MPRGPSPQHLALPRTMAAPLQHAQQPPHGATQSFPSSEAHTAAKLCGVGAANVTPN